MARKKHEEHENHERWLVSYADFITLLFAFFTTLYAIGESDRAKAVKFVTSINTAFNRLDSTLISGRAVVLAADVGRRRQRRQPGQHPTLSHFRFRRRRDSPGL